MLQTPTPSPGGLVTSNVLILVTLVSSLVSGIIGVITSLLYTRYYEKRKMKLDTLKRFAANRYDLKGDEFSGCNKSHQAPGPRRRTAARAQPRHWPDLEAGA